jgi:hypothetical protein
MATTRRKRTPAKADAPQDLPINTAALAAFLTDGAANADPAHLERVLELSLQAAEAFIGHPIGDAAPHPIRHGVLLLAAHLLLLEEHQDEPPAAADIPLVIRYLWRSHAQPAAV